MRPAAPRPFRPSATTTGTDDPGRQADRGLIPRTWEGRAEGSTGHEAADHRAASHRSPPRVTDAREPERIPRRRSARTVGAGRGTHRDRAGGPKARQRRDPATCSKRSICSRTVASMPWSMAASRAPLLAISISNASLVRPPNSVNITVFHRYRVRNCPRRPLSTRPDYRRQPRRTRRRTLPHGHPYPRSRTATCHQPASRSRRSALRRAARPTTRVTSSGVVHASNSRCLGRSNSRTTSNCSSAVRTAKAASAAIAGISPTYAASIAHSTGNSPRGRASMRCSTRARRSSTICTEILREPGVIRGSKACPLHPIPSTN